MDLIGLLVALLIACLVVYVAMLLIDLMKLPHPFPTILKIVIGLIVLVWLLQRVGLLGALL